MAKKRKKEKVPTKEEVIAKLRGELDVLKEELRSDVAVPVAASFGFIIALIWRDAIQKTISTFLTKMGLDSEYYIYQIISAVVVTAIVIILMILITIFSRKKKRARIEKKIQKKTEQLQEEISFPKKKK